MTQREQAEQVIAFVQSLAAGQAWLRVSNGETIRIIRPGYDYVTVEMLATGEERLVQPTHFGTTYVRADREPGPGWILCAHADGSGPGIAKRPVPR